MNLVFGRGMQLPQGRWDISWKIKLWEKNLPFFFKPITWHFFKPRLKASSFFFSVLYLTNYLTDFRDVESSL